MACSIEGFGYWASLLEVRDVGFFWSSFYGFRVKGLRFRVEGFGV